MLLALDCFYQLMITVMLRRSSFFFVILHVDLLQPIFLAL